MPILVYFLSSFAPVCVANGPHCFACGHYPVTRLVDACDLRVHACLPESTDTLFGGTCKTGFFAPSTGSGPHLTCRPPSRTVKLTSGHVSARPAGIVQRTLCNCARERFRMPLGEVVNRRVSSRLSRTSARFKASHKFLFFSY